MKELKDKLIKALRQKAVQVLIVFSLGLAGVAVSPLQVTTVIEGITAIAEIFGDGE